SGVAERHRRCGDRPHARTGPARRAVVLDCRAGGPERCVRAYERRLPCGQPRQEVPLVPAAAPAAFEIVCPAGTPAALRTAVDAGAHSVYCGFRDETNARNFPGLNFSRPEMRDGVAYAHRHGARVLIAINTFPRAGGVTLWHRAVDDAAESGADAV